MLCISFVVFTVSEDARASRSAITVASNPSEYPYYGDGGKVDLSNASQILLQYCSQVLKQSINHMDLCDVRKEMICKRKRARTCARACGWKCLRLVINFFVVGVRARGDGGLWPDVAARQSPPSPRATCGYLCHHMKFSVSAREEEKLCVGAGARKNLHFLALMHVKVLETFCQ